MQLAWQDGMHDMYRSLILKWSVVVIFMQITVNWSQGTSDSCLYMIIPLRRYTVFVQFSLNLYPNSPSDNMYFIVIIFNTFETGRVNLPVTLSVPMTKVKIKKKIIIIIIQMLQI